MRMSKLNTEIESHLMRVYEQYTAKKLTYLEEVQLFQDLVDSGLYLQLGGEVIEQARNYIRREVIKPAFQLNIYED